MSIADITQLAANAGFTGDDLQTAVAIALAESGGNPNEYNSEPNAKGGTPTGKGSYGLWQIYLKMHPEFAGENLYDPATNAAAAFAIYSKRDGFEDWATYNSGKYQKYLSQVPALPSATVPFMPVTSMPAQVPAAQLPLLIDGTTGLPIDPASIVITNAPLAADASGLDFGSVLLWGGIGIFALWLFNEAM